MSAHVTVDMAKGDPTFDWFGPKIPLALWRSIISFFKWSNDTHHCETQVRLFLNTATGQWRAWAFPQEKGGMTTNEVKGKDMDEQRAAIGAGFQEFGSVHHHCNMSAFQSGTDHTDESDRPGLHLTVGNMGDKAHSLHSRALFATNGSKVMYKDMDLWQWFEGPPWFASLPKEVLEMLGPESRQSAMLRELTRPSTDPFPEAWKTNLIEKKWTATTGGQNGFYSGVGQYTSGWSVTENDKARFIKKIALIMDTHNIDVGDIEYMYGVFLEIYETVMGAPRIMFKDGVDIIAEAVKNGELDKLFAEEEETFAVEEETTADAKSKKEPIIAYGMTQRQLDAAGIDQGDY